MNNYDIGKIYQDMEIYLIESMKRNLSRHLKEESKYGFNWTQWQTEKIKELKRYQRENASIVRKTQNRINAEVSKQLKEQFIEGSKASQRQFKSALKKGYKPNRKINNSFFKINDKKANSLINSVNNDLKTANTAALRMINDQYREVIYRATTFAANGVMTEKQAIDMATRDFLARGINCIEYSNGARVNIASYSKMAVRTANQRAQLMGEGEFRKKIGNSLVIISKHGTACKLCQAWEGKILIDDVYSDGKKEDGNYTLLSKAMKEGLYHPNCRHGLGTYYSELDDIEFDENGQTEETIKKYQEDINYCNLQIQKYRRLEIGSLDEENIKYYYNKKKLWENKKSSILTYDEEYAINTYMGFESYKINEKLRLDIDLTEQDKKLISNLDSALNKSKNYVGDVTRSVCINLDDLDYFMKDYKKGNIIEYPSYTSTTAGDIYNPEARVQMSIKSKNGKDITAYNKEEQEILFKRNSKFKVIQVDTSDDFYVRIDLEEV